MALTLGPMTAQAIDAFWAWWANANRAFDEAFSSRKGLPQQLVDAMTAHVHAIHEPLDCATVDPQWEMVHAWP